MIHGQRPTDHRPKVQRTSMSIEPHHSNDAFEELGEELYLVLQSLDTARWRDENAAAVYSQLRDVGLKAEKVAHSHSQDELGVWSRDLAGQIQALTEPELQRGHTALTEAYNRLQETLKERGQSTHRHRPTNYLRNLYHIGNGAMIIALIQYLLTPTSMIWVAGGFAAFAWTCEAVRRLSPEANGLLMRVFRDVAHPDEHYTVNSATWMVTALVLIATLFDPMSCTIAVAVLGFADPMAALVGRRHGKTQIYQSKTLEGSLAFLITALVTGSAVAALFYPTLPWSCWLLAAGCAAVPATLIELYSAALIDDNFAIPTVAAGGAALGAWVAQLL